MRDHVKYCQDRDGGHMICPLCGYTATHRSQMERHLALHNQVQEKGAMTLEQGQETRKFKCLQCGKAFKYKHHLKEHLRIHSGEKPYECSNCKKRFSHSGSYSSHLSSKKCLSGGGQGGGNTGGASGAFNGHSQTSYHHSFPTSPSAGGGTTGTSKNSILAQQNQDNIRSLGRTAADSHQLSLKNLNQNNPCFTNMVDLARLWDPTTELSLRASIGTSLLPYLHSGAKFEQMLQEMLHRGGKTEETTDRQGGDLDETLQNGEGPERKPDGKRESVRSGEAVRGFRGMTCRWCSQVFPNVAMLLQHERYLCKVSRDTVEVPEGFQRKNLSSPPLLFPRPALHPETNEPNDATNGLSGKKSILHKPSWNSVPQQLLVAMHSPPPSCHNTVSSRMYWPSQEKGSPSHLMQQSPELTSPRSRRLSSSGFNSPACLDLSNGLPEVSSPQRETVNLWSTQHEPLDLSIPKQLSDHGGRNKAVNGFSTRGERREHRTQQAGRPSQTAHLPMHQHPVFSGAGAPVFPASLYNGFPIFSQPGVGLSGPDGITPIPFNHSPGNPSFLSPMTYMTEADTEATLKKIYQERQGLMGEVLNRGALDYLSLIDEGFDGEGGPGRKRLKKTDEGLYACDICEKTFQKSSSLLRHKYEHTGKRPHECKICSKAFKHKHHLIEHSRLHSGEKPYQCDKCGKRFSHSGSYSQHMNHRYAYCSKDQDPDQDHEEMPLTPGLGNNLMVRLAEDAPLSLDETQTPRSFLSDSSLDGGPYALKEDEDEEEEEEETRDIRGHEEVARGGLSEAAEEQEGSPVQELPTREKGLQSERNNYDLGNHMDITASHIWKQGTVQQNGDLDKCELNLDTTELPRIKT